MIFFYTTVKGKKNMHTDATEDAWNFYNIIYKNIPIVGCAIQEKEKNTRYVSKIGYRLKVTFQHGNTKTSALLGSDCIFNFNAKHEKKFKRFAECDEKIIKKIEKCSKLHHTLINFSIMLQTGGMNNRKGFNCNDDRLDLYIYNLDKFFCGNNEYELFIRRKNSNNHKVAEKFLNSYKDKCNSNIDKFIYTYCFDIYQIEKDMVDKLLYFAEHNRSLNSLNIGEYCDLVVEFYSHRKINLEKLYSYHSL